MNLTQKFNIKNMIYNIIIELSNGDEANCRVEASNQLEALDRIKASKEFVEFVGNNDIAKFAIKKARYAQEQPRPRANYILQKSSDRPNHYVVTDKVNGIVVIFEQHRFNETQQVTFLEDAPNPDALRLATIMREIGDWVGKYYNHIAMPLNNQHRILVGSRIRAVREAAGLSIPELAEKSGIKEYNLTKIEAGKYDFKIDALYAIAAALDCDIDFVPK
jgi:DNA-binding XRE family transcriptional regulator